MKDSLGGTAPDAGALGRFDGWLDGHAGSRMRRSQPRLAAFHEEECLRAHLTAAEREQMQREMIAHGSALAAIGECGKDGSPCGVCSTCLLPRAGVSGLTGLGYGRLRDVAMHRAG